MDKRLEKIYKKAKANKRRIVLPEGNDPRIIQAAGKIAQEALAEPIILGEKKFILKELAKFSLKPKGINIIDYKKHLWFKKFSQEYFTLRKHKGINLTQAKEILISNPACFAAMMVRNKKADGFVAGARLTTRNVAKAAIQCIGVDKKIGIISSSFLMLFSNTTFGKDGLMVFSDCAILPNPSAKQLAKIAICSAELFYKLFSHRPRVAMLSYSSRGSGVGPLVEKVREATKLAKKEVPKLLIEGEIQADTAIVPEIAKLKWPNSKIKGRANVLVFPDLNSGNIAYKLSQRLSNALALGPLLQGLNNPCSDLSRGCSVKEIVNTVAITAVRC